MTSQKQLMTLYGVQINFDTNDSWKYQPTRFSQLAPFLIILHVLQQKMSGKIWLNTMQVFHMVVQAMEHINNHLKLLMASLPLQLLSGLPPPYSAPPYFLPHLHIFEKYGQLSHEMNITCRVYSGKWMETASQG